jgi:hypothetical protein
MKSKVYIETMIPSSYHEVRTEPEMLARRAWTRQWWDEHGDRYDLVTSTAVLDELDSGEYAERGSAVALLDDLPLLAIEPAVGEIVQAYIRHRLMPDDPLGDALHLALASHHRCDFLLTWNCRHLANANKFGHIRRVNVMPGLFVPALVTPLELIGGDDERTG